MLEDILEECMGTENKEILYSYDWLVATTNRIAEITRRLIYKTLSQGFIPGL